MSFAVWLTGLPASGKSAIAAALRPRLEVAGLRVEVLESDALREVVTPTPSYSLEERDLFYRALAVLGARLTAHGVTVVFDATANKRAYRDLARRLIPRFVEVAVDCPLEVCMARDRKGTYQKGQAGASATVPGLQDPYETPLDPVCASTPPWRDPRPRQPRSSPCWRVEAGSAETVTIEGHRLFG